MTGQWPAPGPSGTLGPNPSHEPRRSWLAYFVVGVSCAAIGATVAALIATHAATSRASITAQPVTVTAAATPPASPAPLPTDQADRRTCNAWLAAGEEIHAAQAAMPTLPSGMTILDPAVRQNPDWSAAVKKAAKQYGQAGDVLAAGIASGTTAILDQSANSAVNALHALNIADSTFDLANGNTYQMVRESAATMDVLCDRLAPR